MAGNRHGTATRGDVLVNELNDGVGLDDIWDEITDALTEYNKQKSALAGLLSFKTTNVADVVPQSAEVPLFEEATEFGAPVGIADPSYLSLGFSFKDFDIASRMSWRYLREADSEQVVNRVARILAGDNQLVNGSIVQRLLDPAVRVNDWGHTVYGLYNGDMQPPDYLGRKLTADHKHYLTTLGTSLDSIHVEAGISHVKEHGYGAQSGRFLLLMHPDDVVSSKITSWRARGRVPHRWAAAEVRLHRQQQRPRTAHQRTRRGRNPATGLRGPARHRLVRFGSAHRVLLHPSGLRHHRRDRRGKFQRQPGRLPRPSQQRL